MNYYDSVKQKIADYISREPVKETEEVISAYTLFSAINEQQKILRHIGEKEKALLDKLNSIYPPLTIVEKKKLFKKKTSQDYFHDIYHSIYDNYAKIAFFSKTASDGESSSVCICKDFHYSDIYNRWSSSLTEDAYHQCIDDIYGIFNDLEYIGVLFEEDKKSSGVGNSNCDNSTLVNTLNCDGFDIKLIFNTYRDLSFSYKISLNKDLDPNGNSDKNYYGQNNKLEQIIDENKETLLKNIPVKVSDLSYMFCMLVLDYKAKEEKKEEERQYKKLMDEIKMNED